MRNLLCVLLMVAIVATELASAQATDEAVWYPPAVWTPSDDDAVESCECRKLSCGCCFMAHLRMWHRKEKGCLFLTYLPSHIGFDLSLSLRGRVVFEQEVSLTNPPPVCAKIPKLKVPITVCIRLYNLNIKSRKLKGCSEIIVKVAGIALQDISLGCFRIPFFEDHSLTFAPINGLAPSSEMLHQDGDAYLQQLQREEGGEELVSMEHLLQSSHQELKEAND